MPRGQYAVQPGMDVEASKQSGRDNSYRACIHAMLIFIAICIILLVCAWPWNNHRAPRKNKDSNMTDDPFSDAVRGDENTSTNYAVFETTRGTSTSTSRSTPRWSTRTTSRQTRYQTLSTTTSTTTESNARKPDYTVIPEKEPVETTEPTSSTTESIARKPAYTVIPEEEPVEAPVETTEPTTTTMTGSTSFSKVQRADSEGETMEPEVAAPEREEVTQSTPGTTVTNNLSEDVEVITENREESSHPQEHYENSTPGNTAEEIQPTEEVLPASTEVVPGSTTEEVKPTEEVRIAETTPLNDITEVFQNATTSNTSALGVNPVCETTQCKVLATRMLTMMNHTVDPCEDFYEYACGGLRFNPTLLGDDPSKDVYERIKRGVDNIVNGSSCEAHKKFARYYKSCVEFDAVSQDLRIMEVTRVLETVGKITEIEKTDPVVQNFTSLISKLMLYHSTPLFDVILDVDGHNPSVFALKLTAPVFKPAFRQHSRREDCMKSSLIGDLNTYYNEYTRCKREDHGIYVAELDAALRALNIEPNTITDTRQNLEWNLLNTMEELPAAGVMQQQLTGKEYELMTIGELNSFFPEVEWSILVQTLLKRSLSDDTHVQVYFKDYLKKMFAKIQELTPRQQHNVLLAWFAHDLYVDLVLTRDSCSRDSYCLRVASDLMEDVSSSLYLSTFKQVTLRGMRVEAQQVFKQLRSMLEVQLRDAKWLDDPSRSAAVSKLKSLTLEADGGQNNFLDDAFIDQRMAQIELQNSNYITLSASLLQRYRRLMYALYNVNPSDSKALWSHFLLPHSTQGIVIYALKKVVIPYGLMQKPMYEPSLPRYLLMARLGFVIAHEMAHHFDTTGMMYGPNGRGDNVLSYVSRPAFKEMTTCPKDHNSFQGYHTADDGRSIKFKANRTLSLNERLADRTAALLSYETYQSLVRDFEPPQLPYLGLSNEQVYYLAMAQMFCSKSTILDYGVSFFEDEHPPPFLRVNTIVDNSRKFPGVFECKVGAKMNPSADLKCEVFPDLTPLEDDATPSE